MKITKSQLQKIIKEELLKERGEEEPAIMVDWDADGPGDHPPKILKIHADSMRDYDRIVAEKGEEAAEAAMSDMLSNETGWLVLGWEWV
jgi:hypothetical protein